MAGLTNPSTATAPGGYLFVDKPLRTSGGSWLECSGAAQFVDDFTLEDATAVNTQAWNSVDCVGTGTAFACTVAAGATSVAGHGGWARGISGATSGNCTAMFGELWWKAARAGNSTLTFETRISLPSVASMGFNVGLTDARTEVAIPITYVTTTFTTTPTDGVYFVFDTSGTDPDYVQGIGVKADVDTAAVVGTAPAASTAIVLRIDVNSAGTATFYQDGTLLGSAANAVTTTVGLCPVVAVFTRTAGAKTIDVDYVSVSCAR